MGVYKVRPVPKACRDCAEAECYNCDYALLRWPVGRGEKLRSSRVLMERAVARMQREIERIDRELEALQKDPQERQPLG